MSHRTMTVTQGHWLLAKMGKKVLRPGGKELTTKLIGHLDIGPCDDIVEFAPGLGFTASIALQKNPRSYTGIELNEEAAAKLKATLQGENLKIVVANAAASTLEANSVDKVYGEAMLTMQTDAQKATIIKEAHRILKSGGLYGIHELGLTPDDLAEDVKSEIQKDLARSIRVNARPLTEVEWRKLLEDEGFDIVQVDFAPMLLLEPKRVVEDEGVRRAMKIVFNIMTHPKECKQIMTMRASFRRHQGHMKALAIVARKR